MALLAFLGYWRYETSFGELWVKIPNPSSGEHLKHDRRMVKGMLAPFQFHQYWIMIWFWNILALYKLYISRPFQSLSSFSLDSLTLGRTDQSRVMQRSGALEKYCDSTSHLQAGGSAAEDSESNWDVNIKPFVWVIFEERVVPLTSRWMIKIHDQHWCTYVFANVRMLLPVFCMRAYMSRFIYRLYLSNVI